MSVNRWHSLLCASVPLWLKRNSMTSCEAKTINHRGTEAQRGKLNAGRMPPIRGVTPLLRCFCYQRTLATKTKLRGDSNPFKIRFSFPTSKPFLLFTEPTRHSRTTAVQPTNILALPHSQNPETSKCNHQQNETGSLVWNQIHALIVNEECIGSPVRLDYFRTGAGGHEVQRQGRPIGTVLHDIPGKIAIQSDIELPGSNDRVTKDGDSAIEIGQADVQCQLVRFPGYRWNKLEQPVLVIKDE